MLALLAKMNPLVDKWYFCDLPTPRALPSAEIEKQWQAGNSRKDATSTCHAHPQAALDLQFLDSEQAWAQVLHGRAELALTTLGPAAPPLRTLPVWDDPLEFVVAPDHPLAARREVALAELATHPAVLPDADTFTHRIVADRFAAAGLAPTLRMTTNAMETLKMLASVGLAWSVLPHTMLDAQTTTLRVPGVQLRRQLGHVTHAGRTRSNAARAFMALLDEQATTL